MVLYVCVVCIREKTEQECLEIQIISNNFICKGNDTKN